MTIEFSTKRLFAGHVLLTLVSGSVALVSGPDLLFSFGPYVHALLGPTAWLLWGWTGVLFYLAGTFIVTAAIAAILVILRTAGQLRIGSAALGVLWLAIGALAWAPWP